jgi:hypothetical protein
LQQNKSSSSLVTFQFPKTDCRVSLQLNKVITVFAEQISHNPSSAQQFLAVGEATRYGLRLWEPISLLPLSTVAFPPGNKPDRVRN